MSDAYPPTGPGRAWMRAYQGRTAHIIAERAVMLNSHRRAYCGARLYLPREKQTASTRLCPDCLRIDQGLP